MFRFGKRQVIRCQRRWSSTVTGGFDLFGNEGQAADYAVYRPQYSANVFSLIHQTLLLERKMALDIGTGTGQVAVPLRTKLGFERVIGIDQSSEQLSHAKPQEGVEYKVGDAYSLDLPDNSASLITIAQALHWLDLDRFFKEVKRVLVEGGTLAVMGYSIPEVLHEKIGVLKRQFYFDTLGSHLPVGSEGCYWDCDRHLVDSGFGEVQLFEEEFKSVDRHWIYEEETYSNIDSHAAYMSTMSAYRTYLRKHNLEMGQAGDPLVEFRESAQKILDSEKNTTPDGNKSAGNLSVRYPYYLILAKN